MALGVAALAGFVLLAWWRNRDILSELYDYSSIIAAAGRVEAGLRPYTDFRSPMQSATYLLNRGAELLAGRSYLGLTTGGLVFTMFGMAALVWAWRRWFGAGLGLALTAAVVCAGLSQHVIIFYNPVGILCLALAVTGLARHPHLAGAGVAERILILGALALGGLNKLNFQMLALALGAVLVLHARAEGRVTARAAAGTLGLMVLSGIVTPFLFELAWTGATPVLWFENVVSLAGERIGFVSRLDEPALWLGPAHDLYPHLPFRGLTAAGLLLLAVVGLAVYHAQSPAAGAARVGWWRRLVPAVYLLGAATGGVLLTVTNVETIALTSLALPVAAAALWRSAFPAATGSAPLALALAAAGLLWAVNGGIAAWHGSRVLFAREDRARETFVRLAAAPPMLRYLEGVRLDANLHRTLLIAARELGRIEAAEGDLSGVMFGPAFEWMERAHPEAIRRGLPVWYHLGTSLREQDGPWLAGLVREHGITRILAHSAWEAWPEDFRQKLRENFRPIALGFEMRLHERVGRERFVLAPETFRSGEPLQLVERAGSNLHLLASPAPEGFDYHTSPWGDYLGGGGDWSWAWCEGLAIVEGVLVVRRTGEITPPGFFQIRAVATAADGSEELLWEKAAMVEPGRHWTRLPFRLTPYGRAMKLEMCAPHDPATAWHAGCRELRVQQTYEFSAVPPPTTVPMTGGEILLSSGHATWMRAEIETDLDPAGWHVRPLEAWTRRADGVTPWRVMIETEPAAEEGTLPVVMLLWYRAGRVELMRQEAIQPGAPRELAFEGWMAEPGGWIGVAVRPLERGRPFATRVRLKGWDY